MNVRFEIYAGSMRIRDLIAGRNGWEGFTFRERIQIWNGDFRDALRRCPACSRRGYSPDSPCWSQDAVVLAMGWDTPDRCRVCGHRGAE